MTVKKIVILILWVLLCPDAPAHAAETFLHFESEAGDYIGQGQKVTLTLNEVDFLVQRNFDNGISFSINNSSRPMPPQSIWWYADFAGPFDAALVVGPYEYATRFPFQIPGAPGLSFSGNGRGCNTLMGRFDVREVAYNPVTGVVLRFAVDFEQHCEGLAPALQRESAESACRDLPAELADERLERSRRGRVASAEAGRHARAEGRAERLPEGETQLRLGLERQLRQRRSRQQHETLVVGGERRPT